MNTNRKVFRNSSATPGAELRSIFGRNLNYSKSGGHCLTNSQSAYDNYSKVFYHYQPQSEVLDIEKRILCGEPLNHNLVAHIQHKYSYPFQIWLSAKPYIRNYLGFFCSLGLHLLSNLGFSLCKYLVIALYGLISSAYRGRGSSPSFLKIACISSCQTIAVSQFVKFSLWFVLCVYALGEFLSQKISTIAKLWQYQPRISGQYQLLNNQKQYIGSKVPESWALVLYSLL